MKLPAIETLQKNGDSLIKNQIATEDLIIQVVRRANLIMQLTRNFSMEENDPYFTEIYQYVGEVYRKLHQLIPEFWDWILYCEVQEPSRNPKPKMKKSLKELDEVILRIAAIGKEGNIDVYTLVGELNYAVKLVRDATENNLQPVEDDSKNQTKPQD